LFIYGDREIFADWPEEAKRLIKEDIIDVKNKLRSFIEGRKGMK